MAVAMAHLAGKRQASGRSGLACAILSRRQAAPSAGASAVGSGAPTGSCRGVLAAIPDSAPSIAAVRSWQLLRDAEARFARRLRSSSRSSAGARGRDPAVGADDPRRGARRQQHLRLRHHAHRHLSGPARGPAPGARLRRRYRQSRRQRRHDLRCARPARQGGSGRHRRGHRLPRPQRLAQEHAGERDQPQPRNHRRQACASAASRCC